MLHGEDDRTIDDQVDAAHERENGEDDENREMIFNEPLPTSNGRDAREREREHRQVREDLWLHTSANDHRNQQNNRDDEQHPRRHWIRIANGTVPEHRIGIGKICEAVEQMDSDGR